MEEFEGRVREVLYGAIAECLNADKDKFTDETQPIVDLGAKSVDFVHIIDILEDEFGYDIAFMKFRREKTIGEMIEFMKNLNEE